MRSICKLKFLPKRRGHSTRYDGIVITPERPLAHNNHKSYANAQVHKKTF